MSLNLTLSMTPLVSKETRYANRFRAQVSLVKHSTYYKGLLELKNA